MIPLRIVGSALLTYGVCAAAGQLLLRVCGLKLTRAERWFLGFLVGSAVISNVIFLLAMCGWIYPQVFLVLSGAVLLTWGIVSVRHRRPAEGNAHPPLALSWRLLFWVPYIAFGTYYLVAAMCPEISSDGTAYHVGLVTRYYDHHGIYPIRTNMYASLPGGIEMLFLFAYAFGRHSAAALVHLLYLLTLPLGMRAYAARMGKPIIGIVGSLLFFIAPVVGKDGACAYNDVATAAVIFGAFYALQIWFYEDRAAALIPAGLLAGFSYACKYTGFSIVLYAILFVVIVELYRRRRPFHTVALLLLLASLMMAPWSVKNIAYVGNPFFPFFNRIFPSPYFYEMTEQAYRTGLAHMNEVSYAHIPWQVTVGGRLIGIIGPVFLLAPLALLGLRLPIGRQVLIAFVPIALPYLFNIGTRFLIPSLPFLALALAAGLSFIPIASVGVLLAHIVLSWPILIPYWAPPNQWRLDSFDWKAALRITTEEQYLQANFGEYRAGLMLDRLVPPNDLVYAPSFNQLAYHHRNAIGFFQSSRGSRMYETFLSGAIPKWRVHWNKEYVFQPLRTASVRLVVAGDGNSEWKIGEVRLFNGVTEIQRRPEWRLTASDNPWEIPLAFDNSIFSSWTSGRRAERGMSVRVDFGAPVAVTQVVVDQPFSQRWIPMSLEVMAGDRWMPVPAQVTTVEIGPPQGFRRLVASEMKELGIRWIMIRDGDAGADDLVKMAPYWGAVEVSAVDGFHLMKLE